MAEPNLKSSAVNGALWTALEKITRQGVLFVIGIILARLLSPEDFGIVGMLAIFIAIAQTFADSGLQSALIQKKDCTEADCSTIFYFNIVVAVACYLVLFVSAPWISDFYRMPVLTDVLRVSALSLIVISMSAVHNTRLTKELRFRDQSIISIVSMVFSGTTGLFLAFRGWGVWALVFQTLMGQVITSLLLIGVSRWCPQWVFSMRSFKQLWGFGSKILGSSLINTVYTHLYTLVIGKAFSPAMVGYYNRGNQFALLPIQTMTDMTVKINFPILSKIQDDDEQLLRAYKKLLTVPLFLLYPLLTGMAVLGEPFILLLIGENWLPCVLIMQILCIGYMFSPLTYINLNLLYVKGRSDLVLKLELMKKPIAFLILFATIPFGLIPMVLGVAVYDFIAFAFNCYYTGKFLHYGIGRQLREIFPIWINCAIMAAVIYAVVYFLDSPVLKLVVGIPVGMFTYWLYARFTHDVNLQEVVGIIRSKLLRK